MYDAVGGQMVESLQNINNSLLMQLWSKMSYISGVLL